MRRIKSVSDLERWRETILSKQKQDEVVVSVCGGTGCHAYGCKKVRDEFAKVIKKKGDLRKDQIEIHRMQGILRERSHRYHSATGNLLPESSGKRCGPYPFGDG